MAEPSRQKHQCQQQENNLWHSSHETEAFFFFDNGGMKVSQYDWNVHYPMSKKWENTDFPAQLKLLELASAWSGTCSVAQVALTSRTNARSVVC